MTDRLVRMTCTHDCPDACSALVTVDAGGRAIEIRADRSHPVTGRHLCVKVDRYLERVYSPDRVLTPLRRSRSEGERRVRADRLGRGARRDRLAVARAFAQTGPRSILGYSYLGSMGLLDAFGTTQALFNRLGATRLERSICGPQWFALSGITRWPWSDPGEPARREDGRRVGDGSGLDVDPHMGTDPARPQGQRRRARRGRSLPQPDGALRRPPPPPARRAPTARSPSQSAT